MADSAPSGRPDLAVVRDVPGVEPSEQFLDSLTAAMRRVADDARETSLADARAAVAAKVANMRSAAATRGEELRTRAEQDVTGIGEWSRAEIVRIEAETQRKIEHRRAQLAEQLDEHDQRSAAEVAALEAQVEQYEGELALFFSQLGEITDPDTFISAARRMPRLPQGKTAEATGGGAGQGTAVEDAAANTLRDLGLEADPQTEASANGDTPLASGTELEPASESSGAALAPPAREPVPSKPSGLDTTTTTVAAVGLGSFGAVTSFKTALEKTDGVSSVRLSLGSGGEFVYTINHRADLDLQATMAAAHPGAEVERLTDGVLHLNAGKRR